MDRQIIPPNNSTSIEALLTGSVRILLDNLIVCIANTVISFLVTVVLLFTVIGALAIPAVWGGYIESMIRLSLGKKVAIGDFFKVGVDRWISLLVGSLNYLVCVFIGIILFVVPGIYLMIRWYFWIQNVVHSHLNPTEAFKKSSEMTSNILWEVLTLLIICTIISGIGGLVPFLPVITTPFVTIVSAKYYVSKIEESK